MRNLPAFPVALEQAFQCSWHFHFPPVTNDFRLHWNENHILTFTVVRTVLDEKQAILGTFERLFYFAIHLPFVFGD